MRTMVNDLRMMHEIKCSRSNYTFVVSFLNVAIMSGTSSSVLHFIFTSYWVGSKQIGLHNPEKKVGGGGGMRDEYITRQN